MDAAEAQLLDQVREQLARAMGWGAVGLRLEAGTGGVDAVLDVPTPAGRVRLLVEVMKNLTPASSHAAAEAVRRYAATTGVDGAMVVSPWLSEASRQALTSAGVSWADATGNVRLRLDDPPLLVAAQGADRNPRPKARGTRGLGGNRAAEVVRALTELDPPFLLTDLVEAIGTIDPTFVSRILRGLADGGLIDRQPRGPVTRVDVIGVVERWIEEYSVLDDHLPRPYMLLGGALRFLDRLKEMPRLRRRELQLTLTGSLVAYQVAPVVEPVTALAYTSAPADAAKELGLVEADHGANVVLLMPNNRAVLERPWDVGEVEAVTPAIAAADLLSSGGRGVDEAVALLEWMLKHPEQWRRPRPTVVGGFS
jgi:hypothetical protein